MIGTWAWVYIPGAAARGCTGYTRAVGAGTGAVFEGKCTAQGFARGFTGCFSQERHAFVRTARVVGAHNGIAWHGIGWCCAGSGGCYGWLHRRGSGGCRGGGRGYRRCGCSRCGGAYCSACGYRRRGCWVCNRQNTHTAKYTTKRNNLSLLFQKWTASGTRKCSNASNNDKYRATQSSYTVTITTHTLHWRGSDQGGRGGGQGGRGCQGSCGCRGCRCSRGACMVTVSEAEAQHVHSGIPRINGRY